LTKKVKYLKFIDKIQDNNRIKITMHNKKYNNLEMEKSITITEINNKKLIWNKI